MVLKNNNIKTFEQFFNDNKREKIILGGYEMWLDKSKYPTLTIYDKEQSQHGLHIDISGEGDDIYISTSVLTDKEKQELINYLKK